MSPRRCGSRRTRPTGSQRPSGRTTWAPRTGSSRALKAGTVWVNCYEEGDMNVPFGGVKLSGSGRDKSRHAMDEYTDLKTTWINYG